MKLQETPPTKPSVEMTFNVFNKKTGEKLNLEPLTEDDARTLASRLQESDKNGPPLVIRSSRAILME